MKVGDMCSKDFSATERAKSSASQITALIYENGDRCISQSDLKKTCQRFYQKLYHTRSSEEGGETQHRMLSLPQAYRVHV